jgi:hypothetical protein
LTSGSPVASDAAHQKRNAQEEPSIPEHSSDQFTSDDERDVENCILVAPAAVSGRVNTLASICGWRSIDVLTRLLFFLNFLTMRVDAKEYPMQLFRVIRHCVRNLYAREETGLVICLHWKYLN